MQDKLKILIRTHSYELFNGNDNSNLQSDYNNKKLNREFVYFIVANNASEEKLFNYESLYITLLKEQGIKLYNKSYKYIDINSMSINTENVKKSLDQDFIKRFGLTPNELVNVSIDKRKYALEKYVSRRIEKSLKGKNIPMIIYSFLFKE